LILLDGPSTSSNYQECSQELHRNTSEATAEAAATAAATAATAAAAVPDNSILPLPNRYFLKGQDPV
tara:strand:+ start:142 stop:342 length:201 start_codon:yes stop_codon:yes gene_type:complete